jgi:lon-related putative ATP-dependent protease
MTVKPLEASLLCRFCDETQLKFETTAELEELAEVIGQPRAVDAVKFGVGIRQEGYNLYALGPPGTGKRSLVERFVKERAEHEPVPDDWCYVNNFEQAHKPRILRLPSGKGAALRDDMARLVEDLRTSVPAAFESEDYRTRMQALEEELKERQEQAFGGVQEDAKKRGVALIRTPTGFAFAPVREGEVLSPEEFEKLGENERKKIESDVAELQEELRKTLHQVPQWRKEARDKVKALDREFATYAVNHLVEDLRQKYGEFPAVVEFLHAVETDVLDHVGQFRRSDEETPNILGIELPNAADRSTRFNRYMVNVLVGHDENGGAPVVYEDNPTYHNLVGRVEHLAQLGALVTDFTMIKPGVLHRANGGYLLLDAQKVLMQPYAWEGLKRALRSREIRMESLGQMLSLVSTVSLEPEAIPLDVKVVLLGERIYYYLLSYYDTEFGELFKVAADFDDRMPRDSDTNELYSRLIATVVKHNGLRHFERGAVARVIERSARMVEDSERLSAHIGDISDLLREADYWAGEAGREVVVAADVQTAIDKQTYRSDRVRERVQEAIQRGTLFIATDGEKVGQVNGLSVLSMGSFSFGQPSRITARVRVGEEQVVDIEREVELGGPIHSKGVFILSGFLGARYALDRPLSLSASVVFEQSYGEVEGDSASSAELYALLSALAGLPIRQGLAVTGSVNQHGEVQPIGGVNEKIEGFFDICRARGLSGDQGVLVPAANVKHLMLRHDVIDAAKAGEFAIYPVSTIDEGIELLTGVPAGERDENGAFAEGSVNARVEQTLIGFSEKMHAFHAKPAPDDSDEQESGGKEGEDAS